MMSENCVVGPSRLSLTAVQPATGVSLFPFSARAEIRRQGYQSCAKSRFEAGLTGWSANNVGMTNIPFEGTQEALLGPMWPVFSGCFARSPVSRSLVFKF